MMTKARTSSRKARSSRTSTNSVKAAASEQGADSDDAGNRVEGGTARSVLEHVARSIVDDPEGVAVDVVRPAVASAFPFRVAQGDMGRIIGRRGRTAQALRTLVRAAAARDHRRRRSTSSTEHKMVSESGGDGNERPLLEVAVSRGPMGWLDKWWSLSSPTAPSGSLQEPSSLLPGYCRTDSRRARCNTPAVAPGRPQARGAQFPPFQGRTWSNSRVFTPVRRPTSFVAPCLWLLRSKTRKHFSSTIWSVARSSKSTDPARESCRGPGQPGE